MEFANCHDLYWGTDDEIKSYSKELFYCLLEDMQKDNKTKDNVFDLLRLKSQEEIYDYISKDFIEEFIDFTRGEFLNYDAYEIVDDKKKIGVKSQNGKLKFSGADFLTFKKLNTNIERFAQKKLRPILAVLLPNVM